MLAQSSVLCVANFFECWPVPCRARDELRVPRRASSTDTAHWARYDKLAAGRYQTAERANTSSDEQATTLLFGVPFRSRPQSPMRVIVSNGEQATNKYHPPDANACSSLSFGEFITSPNFFSSSNNRAWERAFSVPPVLNIANRADVRIKNSQWAVVPLDLDRGRMMACRKRPELRTSLIIRDESARWHTNRALREDPKKISPLA